MTAKWCAPSREGNNLTCFTTEEYNKTYSNKIKIKDKSKKQLWNNIKKALSNKCNNEICWTEQDFTKTPEIKKIIREALRPKMPQSWRKNMTTWLDTDNINHVMKQYEDKYPNFMYVGTFPIDCTINGSLNCPLKKFNINKMYNYGIDMVGIVFNTSPSWTNGEHWFGIFIKIKKRTANISFYDSYASYPQNEIIKLMERFQKDLKDGLDIDTKIEINKKRHQRDSYNCGLYSMIFIVKRLEGKTMKQIERMKLDTKKMQRLKTLWYRN